MPIQEVRLSARRLQQFAQIVPPGEMGEALESAAATRDRLAGRVPAAQESMRGGS